MSSVRQIARQMKISVATVSRALNNHPEISPDTRDRVLKTANGMGYLAPIGKRITTNVGLVFACEMPFGEFDALLIDGILRGLGEQRFDLTMLNLERDKAESETYTQFFMRKGIRGAILRTDAHSRKICELIAQEAFPSIVVADRFESSAVNYIYTDSGPDSRRAVEHLLNLGHRRIAFVMNHIPDHDHEDRFNGYREALAAAEIAVDPELVVKIGADLSGGKASLNRLLSLPHPPTAVYYADPLACVGAMTRSHELRVSIPEDLSIIGFDDGDMRFRVWPAMTAVCQSASQLGFEAALWLVRTITGRETSPLRKQASTFFEVHGTTGRAPRQVVRILPDGSRLVAGEPIVRRPSGPRANRRSE
jgi:DNA-binding LacI/PurR family transcriptional regulator